MSVKAKGINAERDLIHKFWSQEIPAIRIAGSGSSKYPSPDILAGNRIKKLAIESKVTKDTNKYLTKGEIDGLKTYSNMFGAEPWIAVKFKGEDWFFLPITEIEETKKSFLINIEIAKKKGILFEELIKNF